MKKGAIVYRKIKDFLENWKYEYESTSKSLNNITEETRHQKVTPDGRSLGFIAWHITTGNVEMMRRTGLDFDNFDDKAIEPEKFKKIISDYDKTSKSIYTQVKEQWQDENLTEEVEMYGEMWYKGKVLSVLIIHQAHHRAQMTVLMRQAGLKVPGIYGPSKEEWQQFGMESQK